MAKVFYGLLEWWRAPGSVLALDFGWHNGCAQVHDSPRIVHDMILGETLDGTLGRMYGGDPGGFMPVANCY